MNKKFKLNLALIMAVIFALGLILGNLQAPATKVNAEEAESEASEPSEEVEEKEEEVKEADEPVEEPVEGKVEDNGRKNILVRAQGVVNVKPDIVRIGFAVSEQKDTAKEASDAANVKMEEILKVLMDMGVEKKDIVTMNIYLGALRDYQSSPPTIYGYEVQNRVQVTIREVEKAGEIIAAALDAGVNDINQIEFAVEDPSAAYEEALKQAVEKAKNKATAMADAAGVKIDLVPRNLSEGSVMDYHYGNYMAKETEAAMDGMAMGSAGAAPAALSQETVSISATVEAAYDIIP